MSDILIAEDDEQIREWVAYSLERDHHQVRAVADGAAALTACAERRPDLLILDIMMPKMSGYDVLLKLRESDRTLPILLLTAKSSESDKVMGLGLGADDYVTKPFGVRELQARVSALLRRASFTGLAGSACESYRFGSWTVNASKRVLEKASGETVELSELEVGILRLLAAHPGEIVSRDMLLSGVWGMSYGGTNRTLDNRILTLRKKLGPDAVHIETVYGTGYRYRS